MAKNGLLPVVPFHHRVVKGACPAELRHALSRYASDAGVGSAAVVRELLRIGLAHAGWPETRIISEYAAYRTERLTTGQPNEYE